MALMIHDDYLYNFRVKYEDAAYDGFNHLRNKLTQAETTVFFDQARDKGLAHFEDPYNRHYVLVYSRGDNFYFLIPTTER